jgi:serine/threonine protein kinase
MLKVPEATYAGIREGGSATWKIEEPRMKIVRELGKNISGGRITYLAKDDDRLVVLKQFKFLGNDWDEYKAIERESKILQSLDHPQIPQYLDSYQSDDGYCLIQEYINAESLGAQRSLTIEQVQSIAHQALEILVYLQDLNPPVLHRDIKPENILYSNDNHVYLVDFGFSKFDSEDIATSSIMAGTLGFMAPELFYGQVPTKASDLYSLGATLIALANGKTSSRISELLRDGAFKTEAFQGIPGPFAAWLKRMTASGGDRFADAAEALSSLNGLGQEQAESDWESEEYSSRIAARLRVNTKKAYSKLQFNPNSVLAKVKYHQAQSTEDEYDQRFTRDRIFLPDGSFSNIVRGKATIPPGDFKNIWNKDVYYQEGDRVRYKKFFYFAICEVPANMPPPDFRFWRVTAIAPQQQDFLLKPWHLYAAYLGLLTALCVVFSGITSSNPQLIQVLEWLRSGLTSSTHTTNEIR